MRHSSLASTAEDVSSKALADRLLSIPPRRRGASLHAALTGVCNEADLTQYVTPLRETFDDNWAQSHGCAAPLGRIAKALEPPVPVKTVMAFSRLMFAQSKDDMADVLRELVRLLEAAILALDAPTQLSLLSELAESDLRMIKKRPIVGRSINNLRQLVTEGKKFATVYADPPWPYENEASRAAAVNHYPVMTLQDICNEPVGELAEPEAHLHLWTTNAFLREAFHVIDAWGFEFKSCLVWIKHELGMGNYWRVSHEFLLLGVRGQLTFQDRTLPSWVQAHRTLHSRKPGLVRELVEKVSPGPYLELYGREELPNSAWTVYGNQVEKRFF
jgi:N6-adenosine-specific RNA methylase IME4